MFGRKLVGILFISFSIPFFNSAYNNFIFSLHPNTIGGGPRAIVSVTIAFAAVIVGLIFLFKKAKDKKLKIKDEPKGIPVQCHVCDKETFKNDTHEHIGVNICTDCWEITQKY